MSEVIVIEDEILEEIKVISDQNIAYWIKFWSDIQYFNGEDKHTVQSDMLFYIRALAYWKQQAEHVNELEKKRQAIEIENQTELELLRDEIKGLREVMERLKAISLEGGTAK